MGTTESAFFYEDEPEEEDEDETSPSPSLHSASGRRLSSATPSVLLAPRHPPARGTVRATSERLPTVKLKGCILGMPGSGKRTLLARLQGKDPFLPTNINEPTLAWQGVQHVLPYQPPSNQPSWDRIQLLVNCTDDHKYTEPIDFAVILINPQEKKKRMKRYLIDHLHRLLTILGYRSDGYDPQGLQRPLCLCLLLNFRDLKLTKAHVEASHVTTWTMEVLQEYPALDPQRLVLQCGDTSLLNCYGLSLLHHFIYQSYLLRRQFQLESEMLQVRQAQQQARAPPHQTYDEFLMVLQGKPPPPTQQHKKAKKKKTANKEKHSSARRKFMPNAPPVESDEEEDHDSTAVLSGPKQDNSNNINNNQPAPTASNDALEAFLASSDDDDDDDDEEKEVSKEVATQSTRKVSSVAAPTENDDDDDDDDDFVVSEMETSEPLASPGSHSPVVEKSESENTKPSRVETTNSPVHTTDSSDSSVASSQASADSASSTRKETNSSKPIPKEGEESLESGEPKSDNNAGTPKASVENVDEEVDADEKASPKLPPNEVVSDASDASAHDEQNRSSETEENKDDAKEPVPGEDPKGNICAKENAHGEPELAEKEEPVLGKEAEDPTANTNKHKPEVSSEEADLSGNVPAVHDAVAVDDSDSEEEFFVGEPDHDVESKPENFSTVPGDVDVDSDDDFVVDESDKSSEDALPKEENEAPSEQEQADETLATDAINAAEKETADKSNGTIPDASTLYESSQMPSAEQKAQNSAKQTTPSSANPSSGLSAAALAAIAAAQSEMESMLRPAVDIEKKKKKKKDKEAKEKKKHKRLS